jgi:hypothetical protein
VDVDAPDDDRGRRAADRRPLLGERPARVDRVTGVDRAGELPVQPLPLGDRGHGRVDRTEADGHRHDERRWRGPGTVLAGLDRQRREVAGDAGEQGYLGFGDGAAARRPLAAKGKVVERKRLQIEAEYRSNSQDAALTYPDFSGPNRQDRQHPVPQGGRDAFGV